MVAGDDNSESKMTVIKDEIVIEIWEEKINHDIYYIYASLYVIRLTGRKSVYKWDTFIYIDSSISKLQIWYKMGLQR